MAVNDISAGTTIRFGEAGHGVGYTLDEAVAVIELSRPSAANALDAQMKEGLLSAVEQVRTDAEQVRAVLITAQGGTFCVGQDLREHARALEENPSEAFDTLHKHYNPLIQALHALPQPVVAAVEGACAGAGLGLALCADLRVVAATARFSTAYTGIGLAPDAGVTRALVRLVGASRAAELLLLGSRFSAEEAARWGLAHQVVPEGQATAEGLVLARRLAAGPTAAYREIKNLMSVADAAGLEELLEQEAAAQYRLGTTGDHRDAVTAFLARQAPRFQGR